MKHLESDHARQQLFLEFYNLQTLEYDVEIHTRISQWIAGDKRS